MSGLDFEGYRARRNSAWPKLESWINFIFGDAGPATLTSLGQSLDRAFENRSDSLRQRDLERMGWHNSQELVAVSLYTYLFAGNFEGVREHFEYLKDLGVGLVHFMPLLKPRPGENDGGYAVQDYRETDPRLGTMDASEKLMADLDRNGISSCLDFVINHTAMEHQWAVSARAGDKDDQAMYMLYETHVFPDKFEMTVPEVFPEVAPGNFTWCE